MKNENKTPTWITIPEKTNSDKILPSNSPKKKINLSGALDKVNNKFFWGAGFVALAIFSFMLIMPGKFSELIQGDLFDGQFQVIPEDTNQSDNPFFGGTQEASETQQEQVEGNSQPETQTTNNTGNNGSDAVPVQIDPIVNENALEPAETEKAESTSIVVPDDSEVQQQQNAELQTLLENLTAQLDLLKQDGLKKDQQIQALTEMLEQQASHNAAKPETTESDNEKSDQTSDSQPSSQNQNNGVYRTNTHKVQLNPNEILAQNQKPQAQAQQQISHANLTQQPVVQNMNTSLSTVNSQPTTGPMETLMIAFLLSCFTILGFGIYRTVKK